MPTCSVTTEVFVTINKHATPCRHNSEPARTFTSNDIFVHWRISWALWTARTEPGRSIHARLCYKHGTSPSHLPYSSRTRGGIARSHNCGETPYLPDVHSPWIHNRWTVPRFLNCCGEHRKENITSNGWKSFSRDAGFSSSRSIQCVNVQAPNFWKSPHHKQYFAFLLFSSYFHRYQLSAF